MKILGNSLLCTLCTGLFIGAATGCEKRRSPRPASERMVKEAPAQTHATNKVDHSSDSPSRPEVSPEEMGNGRPGIVSEVQDTVTGMAGNAAFKAGQKAKTKIKGIQENHNRQMEDALKD